jgi:hypothetical protein
MRGSNPVTTTPTTYRLAVPNQSVVPNAALLSPPLVFAVTERLLGGGRLERWKMETSIGILPQGAASQMTPM